MTYEEQAATTKDFQRLAVALRERRDELNLSAEGAAARCRLSFGVYRSCENAQLRCITAWRLRRLAQGLELDPAWLAEQAGYPVRPPAPPKSP